MKVIAMKNFTAIVEKCPDTGFYVGYVPGLPSAHSQGENLYELKNNLQEVVKMLFEERDHQAERLVSARLGVEVEQNHLNLFQMAGENLPPRRLFKLH